MLWPAKSKRVTWLEVGAWDMGHGHKLQTVSDCHQILLLHPAADSLFVCVCVLQDFLTFLYLV